MNPSTTPTSWFSPLYIALAAVVLFALFALSSYNGLVRDNESVDTQWAQVQAQYQRRFDLIPNLVNSVQGIMKQEQKVFSDIAQARTQYAGAQSADQKVAAAGQVESALGRLLVITENYPELKSNESVQGLMAELAGTENRISVERMRYNDTVKLFNIRVKTFPGSLFASLFGFHARNTFEASEPAQAAPQVQLNP